MGSMISYTTAAMERAMKVQEVILRALAGGPLKPSFGLSGAVSLLEAGPPLRFWQSWGFMQPPLGS